MIEDILVDSCLPWYDHIIRSDTDSQIREVVKLEIEGKRKKGRPRKWWNELIKKLPVQFELTHEDAENCK